MGAATEFEIIKRTVYPSPDNWRVTTYRRKDGSTFLVSVPPRRSTTGVVDWNEDAEARMRDRIGTREMSNTKLLMPEDIEGISVKVQGETAELVESAFATIIALAERLARVERCKREHNGHGRGLALANIDGKITNCPDCNGTDRPYADWQAALQSLGEE